MNSFKVIIAGGRDFDDYKSLEKFCNQVLGDKDNFIVVSGMASGADQLGMKFAAKYCKKAVLFPANWNVNGKSAGYIRNEEMSEYADALIAFWDGKSKGTSHMIDLAKEEDLMVRIYRY